MTKNSNSGKIVVVQRRDKARHLRMFETMRDAAALQQLAAFEVCMVPLGDGGDRAYHGGPLGESGVSCTCKRGGVSYSTACFSGEGGFGGSAGLISSASSSTLIAPSGATEPQRVEE